MTLVRTNITVPKELLEQLDELAGPRGRSAYISELLARQLRRETARRIVRETAGVLRDSAPWGATTDERDAALQSARASWDRDDRDREQEGRDGAVPA